MMRRWRSIGGVALLSFAAACSGGGSGGGGGFVTVPALDFDPAFGGRSFDNPVKLVQHPTDDDRWYVVEQGGLVKTFLASNSNAATVAADVDALENLGSANEQGLLGMAFDPEFDSSGEVYFTYTDEAADDSVLERWESSDDGLTFDPVEVVLAIPHPRDNHNGGDIVFGSDGFLYYSMGDGGGGDDPDDNGQNPQALLGKILRIDVNSPPPAGEDYAIPPTNPFAANPHCDAGSGTLPCPEIFALGFRNPWRMNFDPGTGNLYVGDVGQGQQEEIDVVVLGGNYGWDCLEGEVAHPTAATCNFPIFTAPEAVHGRSEARAITGGAVYRGAAIPGLQGFYVYGDFLTGRFFAFDTRVPNAPVQNLSVPAAMVSAFGQGRDGEIYVVSFGTPSIQKIVPGSG
jgi:glucose/arabinose dehydrogenase